MHPGTQSPYHALSDFLPDLATFLKTEELYPVHRLDATTTGLLDCYTPLSFSRFYHIT